MAGNVRQDEVQLRVVIDGSPARKELAMLSQEGVKLQEELKGMKKGSAEATQALGRLAEIGKRQDQLRKELGLTGLSLKELRGLAAKLEAQLRTMVPGSEQWQKLNGELQEVKVRIAAVGSAAGQQAAQWEVLRKELKLTDMTMEQLEAETKRLTATLRTAKPDSAEFRQYRAELDRVNNRQNALRTGMGPFARMWSDVKSQVMGAFSVLGALFAGGLIVNGLKNWVAGSAALSDELANVQKATGKSADEVKRLNQELGNINTRTANADLREIAVGLGQAGEEASAAAVAAIDKINVALGDEFGGSAQEITGTLSVLRNNLGDIKSGNYGDDVMKIGNALNELGANGLATAPVVSDIANRVAGVAQQFGVASGDILGLAATFQELGINAERGSTAYVKVLQRIASEPAKFAAVVQAAGMDVDLFNQQVNTDMQAAFITVAKAAKTAGAENTEFAAILKTLDTDGAGVSELLSKMGQNAELLAAKSKLAGDALQSTTSITNEFNTKNETLGATLDKIGKALAGIFVNSAVMGGIESMVRWFGSLLGVNEKLSESISKDRVEMNALFEVTKSANITTEQRRDLIQQINENYGEYLPYQISEFANLQNIEQAQRAGNAALLERIELEAKREIIAEQAQKVAEAQKELIEAEVMAAREAQKPASATGNLGDRSVTLEAMIRKRADALKAASADYEDILNRLGDALAAPTTRPGTGATGGGGITPTVTSPTGGDDPVVKAAVDPMLRIREELQQIKANILRDGLQANDQELAQLTEKYVKLRLSILQEETHTAEDLKLLDELYANERANTIETQGQKRIDAARKVAEQILKAEQDAQDQVFLDQQTAEDREVVAKMQEFDALIALYNKAGQDTADVVKRTEAMIAAIRAKYRQEEAKKDEEAATLKRQRDQQTAMAVASALGNVNGVLGAFYNSANQMAYEQTVAAKMLGILQIGISSAVGVAKAIEAGAGLTFPANLGAIAAGVGAVLAGVAQAKALFSQVGEPSQPGGVGGGAALNNVPLGADGMELPGPGHDQGGLKVYDPLKRRVVAEVEGGELLMSKRFTEANRGILPQLLAASKAGTRLNFISSPLSPINTGAVRSAMVPMYAQGGRLGGGSGMAVASGSAGGGGTPAWAAAMLGKMEQMVQAQSAMPRVLKAEVVLNPTKDRTEKRYATVKARNTYRRAS